MVTLMDTLTIAAAEDAAEEVARPVAERVATEVAATTAEPIATRVAQDIAERHGKAAVDLAGRQATEVALEASQRLTRDVLPREVADYLIANPPKDGPAGKASEVPGPKGEDGESIVWRGPWNGRAAYLEQEAVEFEGSSWIATRANRNTRPGSGAAWDLMAQKGRDGTNGRGGGGAVRGGGVRVLDEGSDLGIASSMNFAGAGVTATPDGTGAVTVTIPGGGGAGGTPASTVEDETTFGITPAVGTDTEYARQDHTHGSPAAPTAAGLGAAPNDATYLVTTATAALSAEVAVGATPGGELGGTWASPTVDATHSGSTHAAAQAAAEATAATALTGHTGDTSDAHDASAVSVVPFGTIAATDVQAALEEIVSEAVSGAPTTADYLVGTAQGGLSAEIVVGTSPGGELGGTWASPTVDATHSGSSHAGVVSAHEAAADPHAGYVLDATLDAHLADVTDAHDASAISFVPAGTIAATTAQAAIEEVSGDVTALAALDLLVGTASGLLAGEIVAGTAPGGELGGTWASPTVDATHSGSSHAGLSGQPGSTDVAVADGGTGASTEAAARANLGVSLWGFSAVIDGGGSAIATGIKGDIEVPYACTISAVRLLADQSGSIVIDVWKDTYANFPPTDADSITASAPPTISTAVKSEDATLTGWTLALAAGDILRFNVDSVTSITRVTIAFRVTR